MAEFSISVAKTLANEGGFALVSSTGECVNFGITCWFLRRVGILHGTGRFPQPEEIQYVRSLTRDGAISLYRMYFWSPNNLDQIDSQEVADKVFDLVVNMGPVAVKLLQTAINHLLFPGSIPLKVDGVLGRNTAVAVNSIDPAAVLAAYRPLVEERYRSIAAANPALAPNLDPWLARLSAA